MAKDRDLKKDIIFVVGTVFLFVPGGLGEFDLIDLSLGACVLLISFFLIFKFDKIKLPPYFLVYLLSLALIAVGTTWSLDKAISLRYFVQFAVGAMFWVFMYNAPSRFTKLLPRSLIITAIFFSLLYAYFSFTGKLQFRSLSLFTYTSNNFNHNHIGDYFTLITVLALYNFLYTKKKYPWFVISMIGVFIVAVSFSRAAYVSLAAGVFYLLSFLSKKDINKKYLTAIIFASLVFILFAGTQKSMIASRQFYFQSLAGLTSYPFGVGLGNFNYISQNPQNHIFGFSGTAVYAEGIIFEFLSGLGIMGIIFIYWFFKVSIKTIFIKSKKPIPEVAMFTVLSVNFLFDYTYFIPTMLWLWFIMLGLSQRDKAFKNKKILNV